MNYKELSEWFHELSIKELIKKYQDIEEDIEIKLTQRISEIIDPNILNVNGWNVDHCFSFVVETDSGLNKEDIGAIEDLGFNFHFAHEDKGIFAYCFVDDVIK